MTFDVLTFIGRFQPFHDGHKVVVDKALANAKKVAIVIGSDQQPSSARNPFSTAERISMITSVYPDEVAEGRIHFCPQPDHVYNLDRWIGEIQASTRTVSQRPFNPDPVKLGLIGHSKDASSFYLKSFPNWGSIEVENVDGLNATDMRNAYFEDPKSLADMAIPESVKHYLDSWRMEDEYDKVVAEHKFLKDYKKQFERPSDSYIKNYANGDTAMTAMLLNFADQHCPKYPPVFYTADAVVVQAGHILLVKRGSAPGKGLWALPGGFVNRYESPLDAALRELREETKIDVPEKVLRGSISMWQKFDDPYRSQRGRTVTTAYRISLTDNGKGLPKVKGSDDAVKAAWVPISELYRAVMFEDHIDIIEKMVGI